MIIFLASRLKLLLAVLELRLDGSVGQHDLVRRSCVAGSIVLDVSLHQLELPRQKLNLLALGKVLGDSELKGVQ
jgi:hypothetical protein